MYCFHESLPDSRPPPVSFSPPNAPPISAPRYRKVTALHDRVAERPRIAAYLASPRRIAFNEMGIFRHYPELDR